MTSLSSGRGRPLSLDSHLPPERVVRASGDRYEIGRQHGAALRVGIRRFLDDRLTRIGPVLNREVSLSEFAPSIADYVAVIGERLPALAEEVRGLADGAGITPDEAWLLQLRRELVGYRSVKPAGDCTTKPRAGWRVGGRAIPPQV